MSSTLETVRIRAALGRKIPGDGTLYVNQSTTSPLIGVCIYCGSTNSLTDEHSIPYALFGVAKLRKASCKGCAKEIQKVEQRLLRDTFGQVREYFRFPTRKAKSSGRWSGKRRGNDARTGNVAEAPLNSGVVALYLAYPDYPPRILLSEPLDQRHEKRSFSMIPLNDGHLSPPHFEDGWIPFNSTDLERCIAKIALCEAIRVVDKTIRDPMVARFIVKGEGDSSLFLGAEKTRDVSDNIHHVTHNQLRNQAGEIAWMTNVRIFDFLPTPLFKVVLGSNAVS